MCDLCRTLPQEFPRPHPPHKCRLANALYCSSCASYGHILADCPAPPPKSSTMPQYVEQLVPPSLIKALNITTKTPLPESLLAEQEQSITTLLNSDEFIRTWLKNRGIACKSKAEIREKLAEWAKDNHTRIQFVSK